MHRKTQSLITAALEHCGRPRSEIAREIGISDRHLRRIQRGDRPCSVDLRLKILRATGAPVVACLLDENITVDQLVNSSARYLSDFVTTMLPLLSDLEEEDALDPRQARSHALWFAEQLRADRRRRNRSVMSLDAGDQQKIRHY